MKYFFMCCLLSVGSSLAHAQSATGSLVGTLLNEKGEQVAGATVSLLKQKDSLLIETTQSRESGEFRFLSVKQDTVLLRISITGYKPYLSFPIRVNDSSTINLPAIVLVANAKMLEEVRIVSKKPLLEHDVDKTVVNVDAMTGSAANNTLEVLAKTPGVTVDESGSLNLNGKSGVLVLIDGRATYMSAQDLASYLRSLPGGLLDKIELIDSPSAKYDAEGSAVINIRLKKTKRRGLTGTANAAISQGTYFRNSEFLNLNYNRARWNWFGSFAYSNGSGYGDRDNRRILLSGSGIPVSEIDLASHAIQQSKGYLGKVGFDYSPSKNTTLGLLLTAQNSPRREWSKYSSTNSIYGTGADTIIYGNSLSTVQSHNLGANANFQHKFDASGGELTADLNYLTYSTTANQPFANYLSVMGAVQPTDAFIYKPDFESRIYNLKADYARPINSRFVLETGVKSSFVQNDNDFRRFNILGNQYTPDFKTSNRFLYDENINAAYLNIKQTVGRLRWQAGLRLENTRLKGMQFGNDSISGSTFTRAFTNVFPNVSLSCKLDSAGRTSLQFTFTRKINRPNYYQYNPFLSFNDRYSYSSGNPSLLPTYPDGYVLTLQHRQFLTLRVGYGKKDGLIAQSIQVKENVFFQRPENVGTEEMYFVTTGINVTVRPWWYINYNFLLRHFNYRGILYGAPIDVRVNRFRTTLLNQFTLGKSWTADLSFEYLGKDFDDQAFRLPRYALSGGIQKKLWNGKASMALGFDDLLHTLKTRYQFVNTPSLQATQTFAFDSQRLRLAFTCNFGNTQFGRKSKHKDDAAEQETQRVNN